MCWHRGVFGNRAGSSQVGGVWQLNSSDLVIKHSFNLGQLNSQRQPAKSFQAWRRWKTVILRFYDHPDDLSLISDLLERLRLINNPHDHLNLICSPPDNLHRVSDPCKRFTLVSDHLNLAGLNHLNLVGDPHGSLVSNPPNHHGVVWNLVDHLVSLATRLIMLILLATLQIISILLATPQITSDSISTSSVTSKIH